MFVLFEDPEYNRRLVSTSAQKSGIFTIPNSPNPQTVTITLAADRREYNPTGPIHYLFFCDPPHPKATGHIQFILLRGSDKTALELTSLQHDSLPNDPDALDLAKISQDKPLQNGDTLLLQLTVETGQPVPPVIDLAVSIVGKPVTPVPDAGYALLRRDPDNAVECVRFAFGPEPTKVELVDPNDLHLQVVRRRAVFQWMDICRVGHSFSYAVQKVTTFGSTHFPEL